MGMGLLSDFCASVLPVVLPLQGFLDEAHVGYLRGRYPKFAGMALCIERVVLLFTSQVFKFLSSFGLLCASGYSCTV